MNEVSNKNMVLAVLLNYNQNDYTLKCVISLLESDYPELKILLIDNGSTKENAKNLENDLPVDDRIVFKKLEENIGYAQGTNYGLQEGLNHNPKYFLIINNDTVIDKSAISELVISSKKYNDRARVTGKVFHYDNPNILQFVAYKRFKNKRLSHLRLGVNERDLGQFDSLEELDMMEDIFVLHPVELYNLNGGYSPYLWVNGVNVDISLKAVEAGYKLIFSPRAKIWHKGSVSIGGRETNPKLAFWNIQSKLTLSYLHLSKYNFVIYYLKILFNNVLRTKVKSVIGENSNDINFKKYANAKIKAYFYFNKWVFNKKKNTGYNPY